MKRLLFCLLGAFALPLTASAHVLDQYLQIAQIALAPDGVCVELRLIPGVEVVQRVLTLIDADSNGQITTLEEQAYAQRVWQDIALSINGVKMPLTLTETQFPAQQELRDGLGTIRLTFTATAALRQTDNQQLYFRNNHLPELGVYLVNPLVPATNEIKINGQERDSLQREIRLHFQGVAADSHEQRFGASAVIVCFCLALWLSQWKHLRRSLEKKIYAKKLVS